MTSLVGNIQAMISLPGGAKGSLSGHLVVNAVTDGIFIPVSKSQVALATDLTFFQPRVNCLLTDLMANVATYTAGALQLEEDGNLVPFMITMAAHSPTNAGRPILGIPLKAGSTYRFKCVETFASS